MLDQRRLVIRDWRVFDQRLWDTMAAMQVRGGEWRSECSVGMMFGGGAQECQWSSSGERPAKQQRGRERWSDDGETRAAAATQRSKASKARQRRTRDGRAAEKVAKIRSDA
ncbi:hypothetical protein Scep_013031 [Stephania cephalantha]|uniref:Uncharacterized protein n=1 Tax=Stephania cephalantha TaxID=152367 RepID=A0AAP0JI29_9MAGN